MQQLGLEIIQSVRKESLKKMELELSSDSGTMILCPFCLYENKNGRGAGKIFEEGNRRSFKCFACGIWRAL